MISPNVPLFSFSGETAADLLYILSLIVAVRHFGSAVF